MSALKDAPGRLWNPYTEAYTRAAFKKRIEKATLGELEPLDEVKRIAGHVPEFKLFEIRWSGLQTCMKNSQGLVEGITLEARLYYVEPSDAYAILGLHAHEKLVEGDQRTIRLAQDAEIERAMKCYAAGVAARWGVDELA